MLVHLDARDGRQVESLAGVNHGGEKDSAFLVRHPFEIHRHEQRRHLIIRHVAASESLHQRANLVSLKCFAALLAGNEFRYEHKANGKGSRHRRE